MFITMSLRLRKDDATACRRPPWSRSDFDALDGERLQIAGRIFGIEHLAVEEGFLAARRRCRDVGGRDAERLGGVLPEVLAVDLGDQRSGVETGLVLAPADVLGEEPEIVALERIGGLVLPEAHLLRRVL